MNRAETIRRLGECAALARCADPMTPAQRSEHRALVARQRAEDERRRVPSPQLPLQQAA